MPTAIIPPHITLPHHPHHRLHLRLPPRRTPLPRPPAPPFPRLVPPRPPRQLRPARHHPLPRQALAPRLRQRLPPLPLRLARPRRGGLRRLVRRHLRLLLVAPPPPPARLVDRLPPDPPLPRAHRDPDLLLQAPPRDPHQRRALRLHPLPRPRRLPPRRLLVQLLRRDRRVLLPRQPPLPALAPPLHPDAGAPLHPSSARRPRLQLQRPPALGPPLRHLPRGAPTSPRAAASTATPSRSSVACCSSRTSTPIRPPEVP